MRKPPLGVTGVALLSAAALAQVENVRFEVFSIKPISSSVNASMNTAPAPNGFDSRLSLWQLIMVAYGPADYVNWGSVEILKAPAWIGDFYDVKGRVAQADLKAWQSQGREHELLRQAVRAVLKERCRLALHTQPSRAEVFELVTGKRSSRLQPAAAANHLPPGVKTKSGGVMVQTVENGIQVKSFRNATMGDLVDFLCIMSGRTPVREKTGLAGRYDFAIKQTVPPDEDNHVYSYPVAQLGLQIRRATEDRPMLVIDHIERPTAN